MAVLPCDLAGDVSNYLPVSSIIRVNVCGFLEAAHRLALRESRLGDVYHQLQTDFPAQSVMQSVSSCNAGAASSALFSQRASLCAFATGKA
jgi:hypothetical protein